jgi:hypothetical protein
MLIDLLIKSKASRNSNICFRSIRNRRTSQITVEALPECATSKENVAPGAHPGEGGVNPTVALQYQIE